jgi:hypothetical protein
VGRGLGLKSGKNHSPNKNIHFRNFAPEPSEKGNGVSIVDSSGRGGLAFFVPPRL